jgi:hypothetical protein
LGKWHGPKKNLCGTNSFWHAMVCAMACHGTHQGPGANLGFEAWDTFQMSYNELGNTLWANGTGQKKICAAPTRFGMPWHTPRHAMTPTKAPEPTLDLMLGTPSKCLIMNLETHFGQMARAKKKFVQHHSFWHAMAHTKACHGTHQGMPCHAPRQAMALSMACQNTHQGMPKHPPRQATAPTKAKPLHGCVGKHAGQGH